MYAQLLRRVEELDLSVRSLSCLSAMKISYIGELVHFSKAKLLKQKNFGRLSLKEIESKLSKLDLCLGNCISGWPPEDLTSALYSFSSELEQLENIV